MSDLNLNAMRRITAAYSARTALISFTILMGRICSSAMIVMETGEPAVNLKKRLLMRGKKSVNLIIHVEDPGDIIGIKEAIASRLEDLGGVRVVEVRPDKERQVSLWQSEKST